MGLWERQKAVNQKYPDESSPFYQMARAEGLPDNRYSDEVAVFLCVQWQPLIEMSKYWHVDWRFRAYLDQRAIAASCTSDIEAYGIWVGSRNKHSTLIDKQNDSDNSSTYGLCSRCYIDFMTCRIKAQTYELIVEIRDDYDKKWRSKVYITILMSIVISISYLCWYSRLQRSRMQIHDT